MNNGRTSLSPLLVLVTKEAIWGRILDAIASRSGLEGLKAISATCKLIHCLIHRSTDIPGQDWMTLSERELGHLCTANALTVPEERDHVDWPWVAMIRSRHTRHLILSRKTSQGQEKMLSLCIQTLRQLPNEYVFPRLRHIGIIAHSPTTLQVLRQVLTHCNITILSLTIEPIGPQHSEWRPAFSSTMQELVQRGSSINDLCLIGPLRLNMLPQPEVCVALTQMTRLHRLTLDDQLLSRPVLCAISHLTELEHLGVICDDHPWTAFPCIQEIKESRGGFSNLCSVQMNATLGMVLSVLLMVSKIAIQELNITCRLTPETNLMTIALPTAIEDHHYDSLQILRLNLDQPDTTNSNACNWTSFKGLRFCKKLVILCINIHDADFMDLEDDNITCFTDGMPLLKDFRCMWEGGPDLTITAIYNLLRHGRELRHITLSNIDLTHYVARPEDLQPPNHDVTISLEHALRDTELETAGVLLLGPLRWLHFTSNHKRLAEHLQNATEYALRQSEVWEYCTPAPEEDMLVDTAVASLYRSEGTITCGADTNWRQFLVNYECQALDICPCMPLQSSTCLCEQQRVAVCESADKLRVIFWSVDVAFGAVKPLLGPKYSDVIFTLWSDGELGRAAKPSFDIRSEKRRSNSPEQTKFRKGLKMVLEPQKVCVGQVKDRVYIVFEAKQSKTVNVRMCNAGAQAGKMIAILDICSENGASTVIKQENESRASDCGKATLDIGRGHHYIVQRHIAMLHYRVMQSQVEADGDWKKSEFGEQGCLSTKHEHSPVNLNQPLDGPSVSVGPHDPHCHLIQSRTDHRKGAQTVHIGSTADKLHDLWYGVHAANRARHYGESFFVRTLSNSKTAPRKGTSSGRKQMTEASRSLARGGSLYSMGSKFARLDEVVLFGTSYYEAPRHLRHPMALCNTLRGKGWLLAKALTRPDCEARDATVSVPLTAFDFVLLRRWSLRFSQTWCQLPMTRTSGRPTQGTAERRKDQLMKVTQKPPGGQLPYPPYGQSLSRHNGQRGVLLNELYAPITQTTRFNMYEPDPSQDFQLFDEILATPTPSDGATTPFTPRDVPPGHRHADTTTSQPNNLLYPMPSSMSRQLNDMADGSAHQEGFYSPNGRQQYTIPPDIVNAAYNTTSNYPHQDNEPYWEDEQAEELANLRRELLRNSSLPPNPPSPPPARHETPSTSEFDDLVFDEPSALETFINDLDISELEIISIPSRSSGEGRVNAGRPSSVGTSPSCISQERASQEASAVEESEDDRVHETDFSSSSPLSDRNRATSRVVRNAKDGHGKRSSLKATISSEEYYDQPHRIKPYKHHAFQMQAYSKTMQKRIETAKSFLKLFCAQIEPFASGTERNELVLKAVAATNEKCSRKDVKIDLKRYPFIFWAVREKAMDIVPTQWGEVLNQSAVRVAAAVQRLLQSGNCVQQNFDPNDADSIPSGAFRHPALALILAATFYSTSGGSGEGCSHSELFDPGAIPTIALICTYIHHALEHYIDGVLRPFQANFDVERENYKMYVGFLKRYRLIRPQRFYELQEELRDTCGRNDTLHEAKTLAKGRAVNAGPQMAFNSQYITQLFPYIFSAGRPPRITVLHMNAIFMIKASTASYDMHRPASATTVLRVQTRTAVSACGETQYNQIGRMLLPEGWRWMNR
ncbi:hypothetical protein CALCODRAFT_506175 [Calocera cornea HHB12733]|uniref:DUF6532 domain-containing protein n=1 Tax=Calocera cornea HHB12733 TaxID=1353952 RepID=A0A165JBF7_9BASI|nr:hypothetical protein CALCODRAFT_506175 [Calocera cornea HHB12733]